MRLALAIALGFTLGGMYSITAHAAPEYEYICKSGDRWEPGVVCTISEILYPTQAPWDPRPGQTLMDQIPNWDGEALTVCVGHLGIPDSELKPGQSNRC